MFNKFVKMVYDKTVETINKLISIDDEINKLYADRKAERITGKVCAEKVDELKHQIPEVQFECYGALGVIKDQFLEALAKYYVIDGSKVHEDAKIFDHDITLSESQLEALVKKHHDNSFMLQMIANYCNRNRIFVAMPLSEKARRERFEQYIRDAQYCIQNPRALSAAFFESKRNDPHIDDDFLNDSQEE